MGLLNYLTFDNTKSSDLGVYIDGSGAFNSPVRRGEMVQVPGRNGGLWMDEGCYENITVEYSAFIGTNAEADFRTKMAEVRSFFGSKGSDYKRLEDTYNPEEYRLAVYKAAFETAPTHYTRAGGFTLQFDCKPQRYLKIGDEPHVFGTNGTIYNPTLFDALPVIAVTGNGQINIAGELITVSDTTETFYIDSELMESFIPGGTEEYWTDENNEIITDELLIPIMFHNRPLGAQSMNSHVSFENYKFPVIPPGEQTIAFSSGIQSVVVYPRWWRL